MGWTCALVVSQQYITGTTRHIRTRDTEENRVRRKLPEKRTACVCLGVSGISVRARMWRGGIQLELVFLHAGNKWFLHGAIAVWPRERGGGKEKSLAQAHPWEVMSIYSPSGIGGTVWIPCEGTFAASAMFPERTHLARPCGASAPVRTTSGLVAEADVRKRQSCGNV
jgi:hypothetical protein